MTPVLKLVLGDTSGPVEPTDLPDSAPPPVAHLVRCTRCNELNGRSADACWNCEADLHLYAQLPGLSAVPARTVVEHEAWHELGEAPAAPVPADMQTFRGPGGMVLSVPVAAPGHGEDWGTAATQPPAVPVAEAGRAPARSMLALAAAAVVLVSGGLYLGVDHPGVPHRPPSAPLAIQNDPAPERAPVADLAPVDAALRSAEQLLSSTPPSAGPIAEPGAPTRSVGSSSAAPVPLPTARPKPGPTTTKTRSVAAAPAPAPAARPLPPRPSPVTLGACTPNVVALGLCTPPPTPSSKE